MRTCIIILSIVILFQGACDASSKARQGSFRVGSHVTIEEDGSNKSKTVKKKYKCNLSPSGKQIKKGLSKGSSYYVGKDDGRCYMYELK